MDRLKDFGFKNKNYKKIVFVWQVKNNSVFDYAKKRNIEIIELKNAIFDLAKKIGKDETHYSDDILRTLQLLYKSNKEKINQLCKEIKDKDSKRKIKDLLN